MVNADVLSHNHLQAIMHETGKTEPREAIRAKARGLIDYYRANFGDPSIPLDLNILASLQGIRPSEEPPVHSKDAELRPDGQGGVTMHVSREQPKSRQRFSTGHEITHTFFPGYEQKVQCRPDPRHRDLSNAEGVIEMLCDIGASELVFPLPWFAEDAKQVYSAAALAALAEKYQASREATIRRYAETSHENVLAVFFGWKLKPTQERKFREDQPSLFGVGPAEQARAMRKLRVEYCIPSLLFEANRLHVPGDKSIENTGVIYEAAAQRCYVDGEEELDLGSSCRGRFRIRAIPLYSAEEERGPNGENAVVAVIEPLVIRPTRKQVKEANKGKTFSE
jgi:IrrE N-terminal-like domain